MVQFICHSRKGKTTRKGYRSMVARGCEWGKVIDFKI